MVTTLICLVISLILGSLYYLKKSKKSQSNLYLLEWLFGNLIMLGITGLIFGFLISINLGNYISGEPVLTETRSLEPVVVGKEKEVFLIKKDRLYYYFTKGKQYERVLKLNSTKDVNFENGVREERRYEKVFKTPKLHWLFFKALGHTKIVVSSMDDIL